MQEPHVCCTECHKAIRRMYLVLVAMLGGAFVQGYALLDQVLSR